MSDPRLTPANARVAAADLDGVAPGLRRVTGASRQVTAPVVDLLRAPNGPRDRQLLMGEPVTVFEDHDGWSFVQAAKDGYVGYVRHDQTGPHTPATHWISAPATHVYTDPSLKSRELMSLSFGSHVSVPTGADSTADTFVETTLGYIPTPHLRPMWSDLVNPVQIAAQFLGTPYLWGGNSRWGIDCSGLVQAAFLACGLACPGDSDLQCDQLGTALPPNEVPRCNDLMFWPGHVAMVVNADTLLHANAHHMAVAYEPLQQAVARIAAQGDGPFLAHKRVLPNT